MSLRALLETKLSLVWRLTLWYTSVFSIFLSLTIFAFFLLLKSQVYEEGDRLLKNEALELEEILSSRDMRSVQREIDKESEAIGTSNIFFRILDGNGKLLASSGMLSWGEIETDTGLLMSARTSKVQYKTVGSERDGHFTRVLYYALAPGIIAQIGQSLRDETEQLVRFKRILLLSGFIVILLAGWLGTVMAKRTLSRVGLIRRTVTEITEQDLSKRVPLKGSGDELDALAAAFNKMLDRIQQVVLSMRRMVDNLAHEIRSPLTCIRGSAETTLTGESGLSEYQNLAALVIEQSDNLLHVLNTMLDISEAESEVNPTDRQTVHLDRLLKTAAELFSPLAEDRNISVQLDIADSYVVTGDAAKLQRVFSNILDNAIKYTGKGGIVKLYCVQKEGNVMVTIEDNGPGIPAADLPSIFNRFFRADVSRSSSGNGLGLSLAQAIVHAHSGTISAISTEGEGTAITIVLPADNAKV